MRKFNEISQSQINHIASKYHVNPTIINGLIQYWEIELARNEYYKPLQNLDLPNEEIDTRWEEWARLCLLYHDHSAFGTENPKIFKTAIFKYSSGGKLFKLSEHYANQVIRSYFKKLRAEGKLLDQVTAKKMLENNHKPGKRQVRSLIERNWLVTIGAEYLWSLNIKRKYAQIISDIFTHLGDKISPGHIRQIVNRS